MITSSGNTFLTAINSKYSERGKLKRVVIFESVF